MKHQAGVVLVAAACSSTDQTPQATTDTVAPETIIAPENTMASEATRGPDTTAPVAAAAPDTTSAPDPDVTETTVAEESAPDGPLAPDFTMALRSGGNFTLSEESKPVYMIFWAEW